MHLKLKYIISTIMILLGIATYYLFVGSETSTNQPGDDVPQTARLIAGDELSEKQLDQLNIEVRLLIADKCLKCHNSTKHKAALILDTKEGIFEGGENGAIIKPGNSGESELIRRIKLSSRNEDAMPPEGDRLTKDQINLLSLWIDQGAHWADTTLKLFREAPLELIKPELPVSKSELENPVDLWVNDYFRKNKIKWPRFIDDRRFIRKIHLDITGRIPGPELIEAFVTNQSEEKYAAIVDNLLSDEKNYTIHWLSFWNDLLRNDYTGTGYITGGRKQITDWLYCAIYDNLPYDEIVRQLVNPLPDAEGFIAGIQWRGAVNASQRTELQAAQNISQSFLGLNLKCASCHNSFVNNVRLDQAYSFANVFADTTLEIYQCDKPTGQFTTTDFIYPELGPIKGDSLNERLASLAETMITPANGRLYRTLVNRIWDRLFGRGIIAPVDDMDRLAWSQDLLDWLAADFIDQGQDLKKLLKTILTSDAYRLQPMEVKNPDDLNKEIFIFKGPVTRRLSAEQFVDAFTDYIYPFYHAVHFSQKTPAGNPSWIWHREIEVDRTVLPKPGVRWFRRKFDLKNLDKIQNAELIVSVDSSFHLFLNGQSISSGQDWRTVVKTEIDKSLLNKENCLAVEAVNDGLIANPAGILLSLKIGYPDGEWLMVSDTNWVSTDSLPDADWKSISFIDTAWDQIRSFGEKGYWGYPVEFSFNENTVDQARAALVALDPFTLAMGRPTRENVTTKRTDESSLLQAMMLSNDELLSENIRRGASLWQKKAGEPTRKINDLFYKLIGRNPTKSEQKYLSNTVMSHNSSEAWEDIIWAILMLPEFHLI